MSKIKTAIAFTILGAFPAAAGGLSPPVIDGPPSISIRPEPRPTPPASIDANFYAKIGLGGSVIDPNYTTPRAVLDWYWKKKDMDSDLVSNDTDLSGSEVSGTIEVGYIMNFGAGFFGGVSADYTVFNFGQDGQCHEDAGAIVNPRWPRPEHTCDASINDAWSANLVAGYAINDQWSVMASAGKAWAGADYGWEGKIERRPELQNDGTSVQLEGVTYALAVEYAITETTAIGLEHQVFDFDVDTIEDEWADAETAFDAANTSLTVSFRF